MAERDLSMSDDTQYVCDRCGFPVIQIDSRWTHSSAADGVFCEFVMVPASKVVCDGV